MSADHPLDRLAKTSDIARRDHDLSVVRYFIDERAGTYFMVLREEAQPNMQKNPHLRLVTPREYWAFARRIGGLK